MSLKQCMHFLLCLSFRFSGNVEVDSSFHTFENGSTISHYVYFLDTVKLTCPFATIDQIYWIHDNIVINLRTYIIGHRFKHNIEVFENSSIMIKFVSFFDEGFYICRKKSTILAVHSLTVNGR